MRRLPTHAPMARCKTLLIHSGQTAAFAAAAAPNVAPAPDPAPTPVAAPVARRSRPRWKRPGR